MKKIISILLVTVMLFAVMAPMASAAGYEKLPIVYIRGNGEALYNSEGKQIVANLDDIGVVNSDSEITKDKIVETCANILLPFLGEGLIMDKWDNYGKAIYEELAPLFPESSLDENGNPQFGTGVDPVKMANSEAASKRDTKNYNLYDYSFCYDWRLSPYDHVDRLDQYIDNILEATGKDQVCIFARCLGGSLLMAYLEKYGHEGKVKNAFFGDVLSDGATIISKSFSGKVEFDSDSVQQYLGQLDYCGELGNGVGLDFTGLISDIIFRTVDLFNQINVGDKALDSLEDVYEKLYKALIPSVCFAAGMATQVMYWTDVEEEDFDDALNLMFGEEGSELRTKYAGLIGKIVYYREHVTSQIAEDKTDNLYKKFKNDYNVHIGTLGKYGYMNAPFTEGVNEPSDALVSLKDSTFGATVADIGTTLSQSYIDKRISEGKGKYISPDKMVDLSTCEFPDATWVIKNAHHDYFDNFSSIVLNFCRNTNYTVNEPGAVAQFTVFNEKTKEWSTMTEDNCADYEFYSIVTEEPNTETRLVSFMRWLTTIFETIVAFLKGTFSFDLGL